jgi:type I restriction enzyme, S subunit
MREGWQVRKLAELVAAQNGYAFSSSDYAQTGHFVMRIGNVQNGYISTTDPKFIRLPDDGSLNRFILSEGDILVSLTGNVGRVGVIKDEHLPAVLNQRVAKISIRNNSPATKELLLLFLGSDWFREELTGAGHGAAQQNVSTKDLLEIEVPVPPFPEQQRIVALLDEAFAGLATAKANAERNLLNARAIFESHLQSVFSQRGEGWVEQELSEICDIKHGYAFEGEFFSAEGEYVLLTHGNFYEAGGYRDRGEKQKYFTGDIPRDYLLREGDLLVAMTEQAAGLLGSSLLVPESDKFLHNQRLGLVTAKPDVTWTNKFFFHVFNTQHVRSEIHASASGVKVRHTSPTKIGDVIVSFPLSLLEQERLVAEFASISAETQRLTHLYERKLAALEELKKSLLHQAFNGEL